MANSPLYPDSYYNNQLITDAFNSPSPAGQQAINGQFSQGEGSSYNLPVGDLTTLVGTSSIGVAAGAYGMQSLSALDSISGFVSGAQQVVVTNAGQSTKVGCEQPASVRSGPDTQVNLSDSAGRRVRLRPKPGGADVVYCCSKILEPIKNTSGMLWPYQPTITYAQEVDYKSMELTHANQDIYAYHRTPSVRLIVDGEFSVQNQQEGLYAMGCIHYLRTVTKMFFGEDAPGNRAIGTPPPVLLFDAYGAYMFNSLPVIVTNFAVTLPKDVDYVPVDMTGMTEDLDQVGKWQSLTNPYLRDIENNQVAWLPAVFNIQVQLTVQNTPTRLRQFNLGSFRSGALLQAGGWI